MDWGGKRREGEHPKAEKGVTGWLHRTRCMTLTAVAYRPFVHDLCPLLLFFLISPPPNIIRILFFGGAT